jgi:hypothetical protein
MILSLINAAQSLAQIVTAPVRAIPEWETENDGQLHRYER